MSWGDEPGPERQFAAVDAFVRDWLAPRFRRSLETGGRVWCAEWREHPEAVSRLTGLWLAWERLASEEGTGLSTWWLQHCDPTMTTLLDENGPFQGCRKRHSDRLPALPTGLDGA